MAKNWKALFVKEDENVQQTSASGASDVATSVSSSPNPNVTAGSPTAPSTMISSVSATPTISSDEKIIAMLWDEIIKKNRPGPDYLELKNNMEALEDLPVSNEQKIITSFKVLKKNYPNFQKDDIIKAIDYYKKVVEDEKASGLAEIDALRASNVDGVDAEIKAMQEKADSLKMQYDELQQQIADKNVELAKSRSEIEMKEKSFIGSIDAVLNVLTGDAEQINKINF